MQVEPPRVFWVGVTRNTSRWQLLRVLLCMVSSATLPFLNKAQRHYKIAQR